MEKDFIHQELEVAQAGADVKEGSRGGRIGKILTTTFFSTSILLTVSAIIFTIIFFISVVSGSSMMLTLNSDYRKGDNENVHDSVLMNKFITPKRGDVIIVKHIWGPTTSKAGEKDNLIKRLIAVGGDRVHFNRYHNVNGELISCTAALCPAMPGSHQYKTVVNDKEIDEWYLDDVHWGIMAFYGDNIYNYINYGKRPPTPDFVPFNNSIRANNDTASPSFGKREIFIEKGEIFFMGDNRGSASAIDWDKNMHSYDCTAFGPVSRSTIEGVRVDTIWDGESIPNYIWRKVKQFFRFKWLF